MARSLFSAAAPLSETVALLFVNRRGYAAAATAGGAGCCSGRCAEQKTVVDSSTAAASTSSAWFNSWVPDPVTGYYRPGNTRARMDPAELRELLLSLRQ